MVGYLYILYEIRHRASCGGCMTFSACLGLTNNGTSSARRLFKYAFHSYHPFTLAVQCIPFLQPTWHTIQFYMPYTFIFR